MSYGSLKINKVKLKIKQITSKFENILLLLLLLYYYFFNFHWTENECSHSSKRNFLKILDKILLICLFLNILKII